MSVEEEVLKKIVPTAEDEERMRKVSQDLVKAVRTYMDENGIDAELKLVGSYSKGTYLSDPDLDLFIMFPPGTTRRELSETGLRIGRDVLHGVMMYADHPYTSAVFEGVDVDLVPNVHIPDTEHLVTAVDRTPFHTEYVLSHLKPGQNNQIRLLKKFMKGIGTYGAEPNARGFSGYLCELLVLKYGTFRDVLKAAAENWRAGIQLDLDKKHAGLKGALVFYDPVDGKRNVASAVHVDTLGKFVLAAKEYLREPSMKFFFPPTREHLSRKEIDDICAKGDFRLLSVRFDRPETVDDNLYSQLWKTRYAIETLLKRYGFAVIRAVQKADANGMEIMFMLENDVIPNTALRIGPEVWTKGTEGFIEKWEKEGVVRPFIRDGRWCAVIPRPYTSAKDLLIGEVSRAGIGKEVDLGSMSITGHEETRDSGGRGLLTALLDPRPPWKY